MAQTRIHAWSIVIAAILAVLILTPACARSARDTTGFAVTQDLRADVPFEEAWQAVKAALREQKLEIYTRDKRGTFVAYGDSYRLLFVQPHRVKYTIDLTPAGDRETAIHIEAVRQVYGVTLLTEPGWHDRKLKDERATQRLADAIMAKINGNQETQAAGGTVPPVEESRDASGS